MSNSLDLLALDGELAKLLQLVDTGEPFGTVASAARRIIEQHAATEWLPAALFRGDWEQQATKNETVSTAWIKTLEGLSAKEQDALADAAVAMVWFLAQCRTPHRQRKHREELAGALRNYLDLRWYDVTPPAATAKGGEGKDRADSPPDRAKLPDNPKRTRRGRPTDTDPKADKRVFEAWKSKRYKTFAECGRELDMSEKAVKDAVERHRKRLERKRGRGK